MAYSKRKSTGLKLLQGTYRPDRSVATEALPEVRIPNAPDHLSVEGLSEWNRISAELAALGLLTHIDRGALVAYCEYWSDFQEASRMCRTANGKDRKVIKTKSGNIIENPYYSIKKRSAELMLKFMMEFGMTPASRTRVDAIPITITKPNNPFALIKTEPQPEIPTMEEEETPETPEIPNEEDLEIDLQTP